MHYNAYDTERIIVLFALEFGLILINIICFYMVSNLSKSNKQNMDNKLIEEKIETHSKHLEKIRQDQEEIFAIKHDLKSNLQVINNLLRQGKYERAIDYLSEYEESKVFIANETYTDNDMINAVLADKFSLARKQGIEISYQISTDDLLVRDTDICSLLSNMLDNAIEGCSSKETHQKSIKLLMNNTTKQLVISAQNTVAESVLDKNPDLQTSKKADLAVSDITITEERKKSVLFTESYYTDLSAIIYRKDFGKADSTIETNTNKSFIDKLKTAIINNLITENRWKMNVNGLGVTMTISIFAMFLGTILGGLICWILTRRNRFINGIGRLYSGLIHGIPMVVLLMISYYILKLKLRAVLVLAQ